MNYQIRQFLKGMRKKTKNFITHGNKIVRYHVTKKKQNKFKYDLVLVAALKNEGKYVKEWIEFHKLIGVDKIVLFNNESTDNLRKIIEKYVEQGFVDYFEINGEGVQLEAYQNAIDMYKFDTKWMAFLDLDEFLMPVYEDSIKYFLNELDSNVSQVLLGWELFGSSGYIHEPKGLVTENFVKHADKTTIWDYKPIVNPRAVISVDLPHYLNVIGKTIDENKKRIYAYPYTFLKNVKPSSTNRIRVNHYFTKSKDQYIEKKKRGDGLFGVQGGIDKYTLETFERHDRNEITDYSMQRFVKIMKGLLNE